MVVKYLFDTHIFLWAFEDSPRLSAEARYLLGEYEKELYFSAVSPWEIAMKSGTKRALPITAKEFRQHLIDSGFKELPITSRHAEIVETLPHFHDDPFDRMLIAQAMAEDCILVTHDDKLPQYGAFVRKV